LLPSDVNASVVTTPELTLAQAKCLLSGRIAPVTPQEPEPRNPMDIAAMSGDRPPHLPNLSERESDRRNQIAGNAGAF